jgi:hypothetical protein
VLSVKRIYNYYKVSRKGLLLLPLHLNVTQPLCFRLQVLLLSMESPLYECRDSRRRLLGGQMPGTTLNPLPLRGPRPLSVPGRRTASRRASWPRPSATRARSGSWPGEVLRRRRAPPSGGRLWHTWMGRVSSQPLCLASPRPPSARCDKITISPALLEELQASSEPLVLRLKAEG